MKPDNEPIAVDTLLEVFKQALDDSYGLRREADVGTVKRILDPCAGTQTNDINVNVT